MTSLVRSSVRTASRGRRGFTLVEILIVVIILGILAAIVIPQFTNASTEARQSNMASQDQTIKSQISLYMLQHNDTPPGGGTSANLFTYLTEQTDANGNVSGASGFNATVSFGPYLPTAPVNPLTNTTAVVDIGTTAATSTGWYYNATTGEFHGATTQGSMSDDGITIVTN
jgi:general secretion pathway protein G